MSADDQASVRNRLRAKLFDATQLIITHRGLNPKTFLWRDLATIRSCVSTN